MLPLGWTEQPEFIMRELWHHKKKYFRTSRAGDLSDPSNFDNSASYDKWAVAYRLIGAYIDCDSTSNSGNNNKNQNKNNNNGNSSCSRWVIWAAYYNTHYTGGGYYEYFGSSSSSSNLLDCHSSTNRNWQLVGVYREELYQFYQQMSKHLWSSDDYEYIVATAGLAYMKDSSCSQVGSKNGRTIFAGVQPMPHANIAMGLYSDWMTRLHTANPNILPNSEPITSHLLCFILLSENCTKNVNFADFLLTFLSFSWNLQTFLLLFQMAIA